MKLTSSIHLSEDRWNEKIRFFKSSFSTCGLCPRKCHTKRNDGKTGVCGAGGKVRIASYNLHHGEEPPVSGKNGSGTIFFSGCTLKCTFCQNFPISQLNHGTDHSIDELSSIFLNLQGRGAHNINLVSPTPYLFHIVSALKLAVEGGLKIPIVYNTSGYERENIVRNLNNIVDIYLPDFKYSFPDISKKYSGVFDYTKNALDSISEMYNQVGDLKTDKSGIAVKGVIVRHLILPGYEENSKGVLDIVSTSKFKNTYISLMSQYFPAYKSVTDNTINRRLTPEEYERVKEYAVKRGFLNGWFQDI